MSDIPVIQASEFRSALHLTNLIADGQITLPVRVRSGHACFTISRPEFDAIALGVLMAAEWPEPKDE